jgi:hypothetical protein
VLPVVLMARSATGPSQAYLRHRLTVTRRTQLSLVSWDMDSWRGWHYQWPGPGPGPSPSSRSPGRALQVLRCNTQNILDCRQLELDRRCAVSGECESPRPVSNLTPELSPEEVTCSAWRLYYFISYMETNNHVLAQVNRVA